MPTHIPLHLLLPAIAGIYISQTLLTAMTTQALPALLREAGASLQAVGLAALWWLPWGLKFVWAPWVERLRLPPGRRERRSRPLLLGTQWALALLLLAMGAAGLASEGRALTLAGGAWALALLRTCFRVCPWVRKRGLGRSAALQILAGPQGPSAVCALQPIPISHFRPSRPDSETGSYGSAGVIGRRRGL